MEVDWYDNFKNEKYNPEKLPMGKLLPRLISRILDDQHYDPIIRTCSPEE